MNKTPRRNKPMSVEHKAALAEGRRQGRAVRKYLEALEASKPKRGRKRTPESVQRRLTDIEVRLASADPMSRLALTQEKIDLEAELASMTDSVDIAALEADFIEAARAYSERKGISYSAFRSVGVPAQVLQKAGIARSRS